MASSESVSEKVPDELDWEPERRGHDGMSRNTVYVDVGTVPYSLPDGRMLMHNHVLHDVDTPSGTNGFRGWTDFLAFLNAR